MDTLVETLNHWSTQLSVTVAWLPSWVIGLVLMLLAAAVALAIHKTLQRLVARLVGLEHPVTQLIIERTRGPSRMALVILALSIAARASPLSERLTERLHHSLLVAFIVLLGWTALSVTSLLSDLYLRRYRLDVEDNLLARKHYTQIRILRRAAALLIVMLTAAFALMTFEAVRPYGVSIFASAGAAGLIVGLAAQPVLSNLIAGVQLAVTQPIRIDDVVIVEGEWGRIEEITGTYVVVRIWDLRRLIVPLSYFIQQPFQNWTREDAAILGTVFLYLDYRAPISALRRRVEEVARASPLWDGKVANLQVTEMKESTVELRALVSARDSGRAWDLRCELREKLLEFLQKEHPEALPRHRAELDAASGPDGRDAISPQASPDVPEPR